MLNTNILKNEEAVSLKLRSIYSGFGYNRFKMSKFEEYDLYVRNKDFLISDGIITFTDTNGKLLALKPDVTLSIIKNSTDDGGTKKLYYDENVYRISGDSKSFKEITQTGLECIGKVTLYDECEVLYLALESLATIDKNFILDLSHAGLVAVLLDSMNLENGVRRKIVEALQAKSADALTSLYEAGEIDRRSLDISNKLLANYKSSKALKSAFKGLGADDELESFVSILAAAEQFDFGGKLNVDFSIVDDRSYYSGVVFKGYIKGVPSEVLSGGRYDKIMKKMGKSSGAIGFAVYLDLLERHGAEKNDFDYDYIITGANELDAASVIAKVKELGLGGKKVAVMSEIPNDVTYREVIDLAKGEK